MQEAFREADRSIHLNVATDGVEAMAFLGREGVHANLVGPEPSQNGWPRGSGSHQERRSPESDSYSNSDDFRRGSRYCEKLSAAANCYLSKPVQLDAFESLVKSISEFWLTTAKLPQQAQSG
jgi:two-component system, chemotaxis family, response regulator Rcp1